jgi:uncharacterized membrane protein YkvA (DUF1232 family)
LERRKKGLGEAGIKKIMSHFKERILAFTKTFKREVKIYIRVIKDKRTPLPGKIFISLAVGYVLMPFDLIPDFIPVIGYLDDLVIVPLLVFIGLKFIPKELVDEIRNNC